MFYRPGTVHCSSRKDMTTQQAMENFKTTNNPHRNTTTDLHIDDSKQHFKKDAANFYGENYKSSVAGSAKGSIFQDNAAEFYGLPHPEHGEKPFKVNEQDLKDPKAVPKKSVLNERRLKNHELNMQRHPKYGKNMRRFWGLKSQTTNSSKQYSNSGAAALNYDERPTTYAQKLTVVSQNRKPNLIG